jgi:hypothetical protein
MRNARFALRQAIVCGDVPLTGNRYSYFERRGRDFEYWNIAPATLRVRSDFSTRALERAVECLVTHHDGLRLQLSREGTKWRQRIGEPRELSHLVRAHYRGHCESAGFIEFVESAIADVFDGFSFPGPLLRVLLVSSDRGHNWAVCAVAHHLTMDSYSVGIFLRDFDELYRQASVGDELSLPAKTTSLVELARHGTEYWLSREDALAFWRTLPWERIRDVPTEVPFAHELNTEADSSQCIASTFAVTEAELLRRGDDDILALALAAISRAYGEWAGHDVVLIATLLDGRGTLVPSVDLSRTVGYINEFVPIVLSTDRAIEEIQQAGRRAVAHARMMGTSYGVYRWLSDDATLRREFGSHAAPQVSLNAFPRRARYQDGSSIGTNTDDFHHPPGTKVTTQRAFILSAGVFFHQGRLCIGWDFSGRLFGRSSVQRLAALCMQYFLTLCGAAPR